MFENQARELLLDQTATVVAMGDLDTFKGLKRHLRVMTWATGRFGLFAQTLRSCLRPEDPRLPVRRGGVRGGAARCSAERGDRVLERVQEQLVLKPEPGRGPAVHP